MDTMAVTTIKLRGETKLSMDAFREHPSESYDQLVRKLVMIATLAKRDGKLSRDAVKRIEAARTRMATGAYYTEEEVARLLGVKHA